MLKDPITLYNILVSQIYCSSLPDVQKVKWLSQGHWVYISPATGKRGLVNQNSLGVNFPEDVFAETWKNWQVAGGSVFFFSTRWSKVFLTVVIYSLTHSISKYLLNTDCYGQDPIFGWKTNFSHPKQAFTPKKLILYWKRWPKINILELLPWNVIKAEAGIHFPLVVYVEKEMATYSSILAWRISWTDELGNYSPWGHKESGTTEVTEHACMHVVCVASGSTNK